MGWEFIGGQCQWLFEGRIKALRGDEGLGEGERQRSYGD